MKAIGSPDNRLDPQAARQLTLERLVFPARHVGIVAVAAILPFIPSLGTNRWWLVGLMLGVTLPFDLAFAWHTRKHGRFPPIMSIVNQVTATVVVLLAPDALAAAAVLLLSDNALTALVFGRRYALFTSAVGAVGLGTASLIAEPQAGSGIVAAFLLASSMTAWIIGDLGEHARASGRRFGALVGDVDAVLWEMVPGANRFSYVSPAAEELLGYATDDWYVPGFWAEHLHPADADRALAECDAAIAAGVDHVLEYRMIRADGTPIHLRDVIAVQLDDEGAVEVMRGVMVDVSDRRTIEDLLRERATHDSLTGLPNRALFADRLEQALREGRRTGSPVALLLLDLDDFKEVNDALGHEAGDRLLTAFAERLQHELRDCDTIARLGGDEFALLLTTDADAKGASVVAQRVLEVTGRPFDIDGLNLQTRASIGIAIHPDHATDAATLSARADVAMYLAKRSGRGTELYEPELDRSSVRRLSLLGQLRGAIAAGELDLEFQPCFDLGTGALASVEAVARWDHPEHGRIEPEDFMRLAEMSGSIQPLSRWVVEEAVEVVTTHAPGLQVSANLSVRNLIEPDLVAWFEELVATYDLHAGQLVLGLTESEVVEDIEAASAALRAVADLGIGIAIDDFGAGRSSLAYLRRLPVKELKLDRSLVTGVGEDDDVVVICSAVVELAHRLGLRVIADGVAGPRDIAALRQMGCDLAQGHFLGEPVPVDQLAGLSSRTVDALLANS